MAELNEIAAPASYKNIFFSPTFDDFPSIEGEFLRSLCSDELLTEYKLRVEARQEPRDWFPASSSSTYVRRNDSGTLGEFENSLFPI